MPDETAAAAEWSRPLEIKFIEDERGIFEGYAATFGRPADRTGDVIEAGAFHGTLAAFKDLGSSPALLWQHDSTSPVGSIADLREDARGLAVKGRILLETEHGPAAYALARSGALAMSIGYRTKRADRTAEGRVLREIDLLEISLVSVPANPRARITQVKSVTADPEAAGRAADSTRKNGMDDVEMDAPAEDTGEVKTAERLGTIEATLAKLTGRLDRVEVKANRPGAAAVVEKRDTKAASFSKFIRSGREALDAIEVKDLVVSDDTSGGYLVPEQFVAELLKNLVLFSPIRSLARVTNISSSAAVLPRRTGRLTAGWVAEVGARPETQPSYGQVRYVPNESACYVDVSATMLEDSAIDIASELSNDFAEEFGRLEGAAFVTGDGVGKPFGFMQSESIAFTPSGSATGITTDGIIDLYHALPSPYRANAAWLMNSKTMAEVRKTKTLDGDYLLSLAGIQNAPATTLLGRPVVEVPDMPDVAAGSFPILFGDLQRGYRIFDRVNLAVLRDPYSQATSGLVRFHARRRVAGGVAVAEAMRKLKVVAA